MTLLTAHQSLMESASRPHEIPDLESPGQALAALLEFSLRRGQLECSHPWQLSPRVARELEAHTGTRPPGGWPAGTYTSTVAIIRDGKAILGKRRKFEMY